MKTTHKLIACTLISLLSVFPHVYANEVKIWPSADRVLKNASLAKQINLPTIHLANGLNLGASYKFESTPSIGGKYSGIDIWDINIAAYPELFDPILSFNTGAGLTINRQVTYIQQFKSQKESLLRIPYDPVTKLPINSKKFFETKKNNSTGQDELILKPGDFVGYRTPLTLSMSSVFNQLANSHFGPNLGLTYLISGVFDVHVFVMENHFIRVKVLAGKTTTRGAYAGVNIMGFDGFGRLIINRLLDPQLLEVYFNKSQSDLFIADYIFNMNKVEPQELYNQFIGSKLNMYEIKSIAKRVLQANPFISTTQIRNKLITSLEDLNDIAIADLNKPLTERRIFKLLNAQNKTESTSSGLKLNLFKIVKLQTSTSKTTSEIMLYANENNILKAKFNMSRYYTENLFEVLPFLNIWGDRKTSSNSILTQQNFLTDSAAEFIGLQNSKLHEAFRLNKTVLDAIMSRIQKLLPKTLYDKLEKPNWHFDSENSVERVRIQHDITFNSNLLKMKLSVTEQTIRLALLDLVKNYGKLKSRPLGVKNLYENGEPDDAMDAYNRGQYAKAYGHYETNYRGIKKQVIENEMLFIPQKLAFVLNNHYSAAERTLVLHSLYEKIPLFSEISAALLLKLIPEDELEHIVLIRFSMSARNQNTVISDYPTTESFDTRNLFREILAQINYSNDRTYNLRNYIKEDGSLYSVDEIMIEKK